MFSPSQLDRIAIKLRTIQIIAVAIISSTLMFGIVIGALVDWNAVTGQVKMMTLFGAVTGFMMYGMSMILPRLATGSATQIAAEAISSTEPETAQDDSIIDALLNNLTFSRILFGGIVEAAIFLNLITFKLESSAAALVVVAIGFIILTISFPFKFRALSWMETNQRLVKDEMKLMR